ncbi:response regulator [Dactylosporangium aurantiacum]|uniref:Response regulator n=1 Tax=Dactylosporangium aurantiacum TaxID=35754 RepID=A0A9Q9ID99_9ACTN|nr:response regulator [Dactylosporangium aurantiacum]MDG6103585.1 response regulator [Dactylosporangium aurantiacum]UWZ51922.1 response regulator [Dactylosporangium aurantiacum]
MNDGVILLVEDNPDDVTFTLRAFTKNNIRNRVVVASDGAAAIDLLHPSDGGAPLRPALILLDMKLPRYDGLEVLRRIRADPVTQPLPVVVLTTSSEERDIVESYRLGANSYVRKPVVFADFVDAANILGRYWLVVNEPVPARPGSR